VGFQHPEAAADLFHVRSQVAGKIEQMQMECNQHIDVEALFGVGEILGGAGEAGVHHDILVGRQAGGGGEVGHNVAGLIGNSAGNRSHIEIGRGIAWGRHAHCIGLGAFVVRRNRQAKGTPQKLLPGDLSWI